MCISYFSFLLLLLHLRMSGAHGMPLHEERTELMESTVLLLCSHFSVVLLCSRLFRIVFFLNENIFLSCLRVNENKHFKACEKIRLVQRIPLH